MCHLTIPYGSGFVTRLRDLFLDFATLPHIGPSHISIQFCAFPEGVAWWTLTSRY